MNETPVRSLGASQAPWSLEVDEVLPCLSLAGSEGLDDSQVSGQRERFGANELTHTKPRSAMLILLAQFHSLIVLLLAAAAGLSFFFHDWLEGGAIIAVIVVNALIGFFTEFGALRSMEALRKLTQVSVTVRRAGALRRIPAGELVPGDIVVVEGGDVIAADMRIFRASRLQSNESSLTGESAPVGKGCETIADDTVLAERANMLYNGTAITRGSGEGVVTATGMASELGQISSLVENAADEITPLEKRLNELGHKLVWVTLAIAALTAIAGIRAGKDVYLMIETSIALAVAAIPEGLPIVATMALARGMWRMSRRQALINRLSAVETLGATSVICSDKTGTLTENRMEVVKFVLADGEAVEMGTLPENQSGLDEILETIALCNNASLDGVGDPIEVALLGAVAKAAFDIPDHPRVGEEAFDSDAKMMATTYRDGDRFDYYVKGAPESVIDACQFDRPEEGGQWMSRNESLAETGLRVLGVARKQSRSDSDAPYEALTFLGLVGLVDPPRDDVRTAISECRASGIRVVMITGDQPATAAYVANAVGLASGLTKSEVVTGSEISNSTDLTEPTVFARVSPKQKLDIIESYQRKGMVVAMTGDGVNDAPALKEADIGIAMGLRGTEVAKEAADMILKDDAFSSIVTAVEQGRIIFSNIRRFVLYLMSCNLSEILIVGLAAAVDSPLPILPLQILFLNMVTDVFPALALGMGNGHGNMMRQRPRDPAEPILRRGDWIKIAGYSVTMCASILAAFALALVWLKVDTAEAVSIAFIALAGAQLVHVFNMRDRSEGLFVNQITRNRYIWAALALCIVLLAIAVHVPAVANILSLQSPSFAGWQLVVAATFAPLLISQVICGLSGRASNP